jgi:cell wall-associated NlpC family hydrolase
LKKNLVTAAATAGLILTAFGASASAQENTYTVQAGDSLWKISKLNNVSIDNLKAWNQLSSDQIYVNQKLALNYTVKTGDSLWAIARTYGTTVKELKTTNGLTTNIIRIGQQLKIPNTNTNATSISVSTTQNNQTSYIVQKGDSLSTIGARYNLTVSELKSMNNLTSNTIIVGNILKLRSERANAASNNGASTSAANQSTKPNATVSDSSKTVEESSAPAASVTPQEVQKPTSVTPQEVQKPTSVTPQEVQKPAASVTPQEVQKPAASVTPQEVQKPAASVTPQEVQKPAASVTPQVVQKPAASVTPQVVQKPAASVAPQEVQKPAASVTPQEVQKPAAAAPSNVQAIIDEAKKYIGTPYLWGGNTPDGFDCSGYVKYVFAKFGVSLPRTTETQWSATTPVSTPSVGDLVFFQTYKVGPSHVGIYLGNNKFISAASSGVTISDMTSSYWGTRYLGARKAF